MKDANKVHKFFTGCLKEIKFCYFNSGDPEEQGFNNKMD
jgi:hypothetical protein